jgi:hypothetical protein
MALLERFRTKPLWQHEDPSVRAEAVRSLPAAEKDTFLALFHGDPELSVRKAALRRIADVPTLVRAAREDAAPAIREEAASLLLRLATETADASAASEAAAALSEPRHLVALVRGSRHAAVRETALARLGDARSLASVAKTAEDPALRMAAVGRLTEAASLLDVALRCEHREAAVAALERIQDPESLKEVAAHARQKAAARRARTLLEQLTGHPQAVTPEERKTRAHELLRGLEGVHSSTDWEHVAGELTSAEAEWTSLQASSDAALQARFEAASAALRSRLEGHERAEAESRARARLLERALAARRALCERIEALTGDDAPARLDEARAEWAALEAVEAAQLAELQARFEKAAAGCRARHESWTRDEARRSRLTELAAELYAVAQAGGADAGAKAAPLRKEWETLRAQAPVANDLELTVKAALARLGERSAHDREERDRRARENQKRLEALCAQAEAFAKAEGLQLKDAERCLREIRAALTTPGPLTTKKDREALAERLKAARAALYPRVQELREAEDWKRWANVAVQQELCAQMEALVGQENPDKATAELDQLQERWRQFSQARKEEAAGLWERFKTARDQVQARVGEHLKQKAAEEAENLRLKEALCVRAEALTASTDWLKTADELKKLQAEWKAIGPVPRRKSKALWDRFHGACDKFFTARKQDLDQRKHGWAENLEKKEALCARAEALAASSDWEAAAAEIRKVQAEWKAVGPVRKSRSEAVWTRFRGACDQFFERYKRKDEIASAEQLAAREALVAELEALVPPAGETSPPPPDSLAVTVQDVLGRWRQAPSVPRESLEPLGRRLQAARDRLVETWTDAFKGTELDPEVNRARLDKLCARVEALAQAHGARAGSTESLAERLREALATNAMGGRAAVEARWRAAAEEIEQARAAWKRVGPVPGEAGRSLAERFRKACDHVLSGRPR